ncbi:MAG: glycosyltransferase family 4 protein [Pseudomonadota bacterium]|nr:glycosyltransferase family 4 protein [Pseudomonadota bacterium]
MICIQYARPASGKDDSEVFGLDVAVTNFLSAWFRHGQQNRFLCRPANIPSFDHFKELARAAGLDPETRCIGLDPRHPRHNLEPITCLFRPDPLIADLTWQRQQLKGPGFAACGLVHTMSGDRIARAVGELCVAPSDALDALICPSDAVRDAVQNLWQIYSEHLNHRFGGTFRCPVQTPVIPLGVDTEKFIRLTAADKRDQQRKALGIQGDEVVLMFTGRLSFATKAHPLALFLASERAAKTTKAKLRLVMFGYYKPKDMEQHFLKLAAEMCKTVRVDFILNDDARFPDGFWAGADIFISLSDNVQESFGLTPIEAMASGLPAIVTDWNGYRGGVRDGLEGYLVPTFAPPPPAGLAIAENYFNQGNYGVALMGAAQSTAVDIERCAAAIQALASDANLRLRFGQNGRARAHSVYDWRHIIRAYQELWQDLGDKRKAAPPQRGVPPAWPAVHPAFPNPWQMFRSFPTSHLEPSDSMRIVMDKDQIAAIMAHDMNFFVPDLLAPREILLDLIEAIRQAPTARVDHILNAADASEHDRLWRCIGWMLKHGVAQKV